jgi:hypothetical protein
MKIMTALHNRYWGKPKPVELPPYATIEDTARGFVTKVFLNGDRYGHSFLYRNGKQLADLWFQLAGSLADPFDPTTIHTFNVQKIGVTDNEQRKGYATMLVQVTQPAVALNAKVQLQGSFSEVGKAWALASEERLGWTIY